MRIVDEIVRLIGARLKHKKSRTRVEGNPEPKASKWAHDAFVQSHSPDTSPDSPRHDIGYDKRGVKP